MAPRYEPGETVKIRYTARRLKTGLTDCKCTIWDASDTLAATAEVMTELGNGLYIYSYELADDVTPGDFTHYSNSDSENAPESGSFTVGSVWDTQLSEHTATGTVGKKLNDISRTGGRGAAAAAECMWKGADFKKLWAKLDTVEKLITSGLASTSRDLKPLLRLFKSIIESIIEIRKDLTTLKKTDADSPKLHDEIISEQKKLESNLKELTELVVESTDPEILEDYESSHI